MKPLPLVLVAVMALAASVRSQEEEAAPSRGSTVAPGVLPTTARIIGNIPDGTPPPPQPPKPKFIVPARDILATTNQQQGGRTITLHRIKPIALPPPPEPAPAVDINNPAFQERLAKFREDHPKSEPGKAASVPASSAKPASRPTRRNPRTSSSITGAPRNPHP